VRGKVVGMNWRSTHIDIGSGVQIIPNATIAGASFANLSRPTEAHTETVETTFTPGDAPHVVTATLLDVAGNLSMLRPGAAPSVRVIGEGVYATSLPLSTASDASAARSQFLTWLWYASRRDEIGLDGHEFVQRPREDVVEALDKVASTLDLTDEDVETIADRCEIETFGAGERIEWEGRLSQRFSFILSGVVRTSAAMRDGASTPVGQLDRGEVLGLSGLVREPAIASQEALTVVDVLQVPIAVIDELVAASPRLARRLSEYLQARRDQVRDAFAELDSVATGNAIDLMRGSSR